MNDASAPQVADQAPSETAVTAPRVTVLVTELGDADLPPALAAISRQVYEPSPDVVVISGDGDDAPHLPAGAITHPTVESAISAAGAEVDYFWILHADARPRPDALRALVSELERNGAAMGGSKLLKAGTHDELESIGSSTDVFGEPYTGIDDGEIDLQQYDVVREVAFVSSASLLVRRDLAQGLRGLDPALPPVAAGLDFSQRARLAGGAVISVPSSEVYHQGRCRRHLRGWKEEAGRLRAMLIAYRPLTLAWVLPADFLVSILDGLANLLLLRWRPLVRHLLAWAWNLLRLPSTVGQRRRFAAVRATGDEELFRFQAAGSVRLREVGEELSGRFLSLFDEEGLIAERARKAVSSPGVWGAAAALAVILIASYGLFLDGVPNVGFSFPFEPPSLALERWMGGWNDAGLGSGSAVHPSVGLTGALSALWFGAEGAARFLSTLGSAALAVFGMGLLAGRLGLRGPGRFLGGLVLISGPGTAVLAEAGGWHAMAAAAVLPWAVRTAFPNPHLPAPGRLQSYGWALVSGMFLGALSPLLVVVPVVFVLLWRSFEGRWGRVVVSLAISLGVIVALPFLLTNPGWLIDPDRRLGMAPAEWWPILAVAAAIPLVFVANDRAQRLGIVGGLLAVFALVAARVPFAGIGVEEALLVTASFGAALITAAGLDSISTRPQRLAANLGAAAILALSLITLVNGRLGISPGDVNEEMAFAAADLEERPPSRVLMASVNPGEIPGEARSGPGFWYRLIDGAGMTHDEVWLPAVGSGDQALRADLAEISSGSQLRAGDVLGEYGVEWVVLEGPEFALDRVLFNQVDMFPVLIEEGRRVFKNSNPAPVASSDAGPWARSGTGFAGPSDQGRARLAVTYHASWSPDPEPEGWALTVSAEDGNALFEGDSDRTVAALGSIVVALTGVVMAVVGRLRR